MSLATLVQSQAQAELDQLLETQAEAIAPDTLYITHPDVKKYPKARTYGFTATVFNQRTAKRSQADIVVINPSLTSIQRAVATVLGNDWNVSFPEATGLPF